MKAKKILNNCKDEHKFWCNNGEVYNNLAELVRGLKNMSFETFSHHVNTEKNDFQNWTRDVFEDKKLAKKLGLTKTNISMAKILESKLKELKSTRNPLRQ